MENNIKIQGHSGCSLNIIEDKVEKTTTHQDYNTRLKKQCIKQKEFKSKVFSTPKIIEDGYKGDKYYFSMEFIPYKSFDEVFKIADKNLLDNIAIQLINFVKNNEKNTKYIESNIIIDKFEETKIKIRLKHDIDISYLNKVFYNLDSQIKIPTGKCHGDLTFSNLLFNNRKIVLLDFLDTYLESPIQDIVKIKQDTQYFWSIRRLKHNVNILKIKQCFNYINKIIDKNLTHYEHYNLFQILNLLRIIPYCDNKDDIRFLLKNINNLCIH